MNKLLIKLKTFYSPYNFEKNVISNLFFFLQFIKILYFGTKHLATLKSLRWPNTVSKCLCIIHHNF